MSELIDTIRTLGHWEVVIRPRDFEAHHVDYGSLEDILNRAVVRLRGWPVPFIDYRDPYLRGKDWIGQDIEPKNSVMHSEAWRFFTSGQFSHLRVLSAEYDSAPTPPPGCTSVIQVWEILYYLTEVFELASRLALSPAGSEWMTVSARLNGLEGRSLVIGEQSKVEFSEPKTTSQPALVEELTLDRDHLVANARDHAAAMAREFVMRFGWSPSLEQLVDSQRGLTERA